MDNEALKGILRDRSCKNCKYFRVAKSAFTKNVACFFCLYNANNLKLTDTIPCKNWEQTDDYEQIHFTLSLRAKNAKQRLESEEI
jgi:hypothetical protein